MELQKLKELTEIWLTSQLTPSSTKRIMWDVKSGFDVRRLTEVA
jgi:hypothetical protein